MLIKFVSHNENPIHRPDLFDLGLRRPRGLRKLIIPFLIGLSAIHADGAEPGLVAVGERMTEAFSRDLQAFQSHAIERQVIRREFNRRGGVKNEQVLVMHVTPRSTGMDEKLIRINGRTPTKRQVEKHRNARTFERHFNQLKAGRVELPILSDIALPLLMDTYEFIDLGEEIVDDVRCYRFGVTPFDPPDGASKTERIAAASEGMFLITVEGSHLVRMETRIVRPLKTFGIGLKQLALRLESAPQGDTWHLKRIEVNVTYQTPITVRRHNVWTYRLLP